jgi:UPF0716 protein FxsA
VLARLFLLFTLVPLVELALLIWLAQATDWRWALLLAVGTGLAGAVLIRHQGRSVWRRVQTELSEGRVPADPLLDAALVLVAGVLLLTPGVLTDVVAVLLLVPWTRRLAKRWLRRWFERRFRIAPTAARDEIIDVRVVERPHERGDR